MLFWVISKLKFVAEAIDFQKKRTVLWCKMMNVVIKIEALEIK